MVIDKKTLRNVFIGVGGCILLYWLLHETDRVKSVFNILMAIFSPFVIGSGLAFVLNVPMRGIEKHLKFINNLSLRRLISVVLTFVLILLVLFFVFWLLLPQVIETVETLIANLPGFFNGIYENVLKFLNENPEVMKWVQENTDFESINWSGLIQKAVDIVGNSVSTILDKTVLAIGSVSSGIFNFVIALVFSLYCLFRKEILARQFRRLAYAFLPEKFCDKAVRILRLTNTTFSNFISGQCLEALILGCLFAISMLIFQMPYIPLVSVLVAVTALVPIVGAFVGCILGAFFILVNDPIQALWFVVMFLVIQQFEGNVIYPKVVGKSVGLPGMWVLLAVTLGGELMGVAGMLIMIPLVSVLYTLLREITNKRLEERKIDKDKLRDHPPEMRNRLSKTHKKEKKIRFLQKLMRKKSEETPSADEEDIPAADGEETE